MKRLCLLDRDGVIVRELLHCLQWLTEVRFEDGAAEGLKLLHSNGTRCVVITNQSCVGTGQCTSEEVALVNAEISGRVADAGGLIDSYYVCPHMLQDDCECRKPRTCMLEQACRDYELSDVCLVGDSLTDLLAAQRFGIDPILVRTGKGRETEAELDFEVPVVDTLKEAAELMHDL